MYTTLKQLYTILQKKFDINTYDVASAAADDAFADDVVAAADGDSAAYELRITYLRVFIFCIE